MRTIIFQGKVGHRKIVKIFFHIHTKIGGLARLVSNYFLYYGNMPVVNIRVRDYVQERTCRKPANRRGECLCYRRPAALRCVRRRLTSYSAVPLAIVVNLSPPAV